MYVFIYLFIYLFDYGIANSSGHKMCRNVQVTRQAVRFVIFFTRDKICCHTAQVF